MSEPVIVKWEREGGEVRDGLPFQRIRDPNGLRRGRREGQLHSQFEWAVRYPTNAVPSEGRASMLFMELTMQGPFGGIEEDEYHSEKLFL